MPVRVPYDRRFLDSSFEWFQSAELRDLTMTPEVTKEGQRAWFATLPKPDYLIWGIEQDGAPIGAFGLKQLTSTDAEYWGYIGEPEYRGKGVGHWMVKTALDEAKTLGLDSVYLKVIQHNPAIRLYKRMGFVPSRVEGHVIRMDVSIS